MSTEDIIFLAIFGLPLVAIVGVVTAGLRRGGMLDFSLRDEDRDHCTFCRAPPKWLCVGFMAPAVTACDGCLERLRGVPMRVGPLPDKQN